MATDYLLEEVSVDRVSARERGHAICPEEVVELSFRELHLLRGKLFHLLGRLSDGVHSLVLLGKPG